MIPEYRELAREKKAGDLKAMEHRWGKRQVTNVRVRFVCAPAVIGTGRVTNISLTGAFLETTMKLRILSVVCVMALDVRLANGRIKGMSACVVRRDSTGVGLEWCESVAEKTSVDARLMVLNGREISTDIGSVQAPAPDSISPIPLSANHR